MRDYLQILIMIIAGIALIGLCYSLLMGQWSKVRRQMMRGSGKGKPGAAGDPKVCLVCRAKLESGELIKTQAFPSLTGGTDKQMHIQGCVYCLGGGRDRICPVCKMHLSTEEKLVARMFDRSFRRHHVHILGCDYCRVHKRRPPATAERVPAESPLSPTKIPKA
ncbi:MAG: hypothetical protein FWD88_07360 [Treponema sp.]|nr:hypothetical protein [Treponema sp.]